MKYLVALAIAATCLFHACAPKKHCKGLKAHPNYSKKW